MLSEKVRKIMSEVDNTALILNTVAREKAIELHENTTDEIVKINSEMEILAYSRVIKLLTENRGK